MRFLLKKGAGKHSEFNKIYKPGDVVESPHDLVEKFPLKFEKLPDLPQAPVNLPALVTNPQQPQKKSKPKKADDSGSKAEDKSKPSLGTEVTDSYPRAVEESYQVFRRGSHFYLYEEGGTVPINPKGLKKDKVDEFLANYLEE